jgi:uncharacterized membrane protein YiaA
MPLGLQALLPFVALLGAAAIVSRRSRDPTNGWIASGATAVAAVIALIELLRLSPGEHVDVPYLTTFPYADLAIRLDGLSLAFGTMILITASLLMLARVQVKGDRREPWVGWLLTSAAAAAVVFAANLLLVFIMLQLLTLAWSGALDETAPRRRGLRLSVQLADIGLLLAAAGAIQSVGTSAFSGVPSDTFGLAAFLLVLVPVVVRVGALAWASGGPQAPVAFEPAIGWVAPAGYLLLRLLSLMGGRLPDRITAVALYIAAALAAVLLAALALRQRSGVRLATLLVAAQASLALAYSAGAEPLLTIASVWLWLLLIPLAGVASVRVSARSASEALMLLNLAMIPGTVAFLGLWVGGLALNERGLLAGLIPIAAVLVLSAIAALGRIPSVRRIAPEITSLWAGALLVIAAVPIIVINPLVLPAAGTVRLVPGGSISANPFGVSTADGGWPALGVSVAIALLLGAAIWRLGPRLPLWRGTAVIRTPRWAVPMPDHLPRLPGWSQAVLWGAFAAALALIVLRP